MKQPTHTIFLIAIGFMIAALVSQLTTLENFEIFSQLMLVTAVGLMIIFSAIFMCRQKLGRFSIEEKRLPIRIKSAPYFANKREKR